MTGLIRITRGSSLRQREGQLSARGDGAWLGRRYWEEVLGCKPKVIILKVPFGY